MLVILLAAMVAIAAAEIALRNIWGSGLAWSDPLLRVLVLWVGLMGAVAATRDRRHITIDVLSRYLPSPAKTIVRMASGLFTSCVCAVIAYHGARFVYLDMEAGTRAFAAVPAWVCEIIIPLGFGLMALRALVSIMPGASAPLE